MEKMDNEWFTAHKVWIYDLLAGSCVSQEGMSPDHVDVEGRKVARANIIASVIEKFINDDRTYGTLTLDDGSAQIRAKVFRDSVGLIDNIEVGSTIVLVGNVRSFNNEIYVVPDLLKVVNEKKALVRRLELVKEFGEREGGVVLAGASVEGGASMQSVGDSVGQSSVRSSEQSSGQPSVQSGGFGRGGSSIQDKAGERVDDSKVEVEVEKIGDSASSEGVDAGSVKDSVGGIREVGGQSSGDGVRSDGGEVSNSKDSGGTVQGSEGGVQSSGVSNVQNESSEEVKEAEGVKVVETGNVKERIVSFMKGKDEGEGVEISQILESFGVEERVAVEGELAKMRGVDVYELRPGRVRLMGD